MLRIRLVACAFLLSIPNDAFAVDEYRIAGTFDGCEYDKLYEIVGGGILECREYNYFYEFGPRVIADGRDVLLIGKEKVDATLHNGSVVTTHISDDFEGCDFDKVYRLDNGLLFECATYRYQYAYRPEVKIFVIEGRSPVVFIRGRQYNGTLYRTQ